MKLTNNLMILLNTVQPQLRARIRTEMMRKIMMRKMMSKLRPKLLIKMQKQNLLTYKS